MISGSTSPSTPVCQGTLSLPLEGVWVQRWCTVLRGKLFVYASKLAADLHPAMPLVTLDLSIYDSLQTSHSWSAASSSNIFEIRLASREADEFTSSLQSQDNSLPRSATTGSLSTLNTAAGAGSPGLLGLAKPHLRGRPVLAPVQPRSPLAPQVKSSISYDGITTSVPKASPWSRFTGRARKSIRVGSPDVTLGRTATPFNDKRELGPSSAVMPVILRAQSASDMLHWAGVISPLLVDPTASMATCLSRSLSPAPTNTIYDLSLVNVGSPQEAITDALLEQAGNTARRRRAASAEAGARRARLSPCAVASATSSSTGSVLSQRSAITYPKRRLSRILSGCASNIGDAIELMDESMRGEPKSVAREIDGGCRSRYPLVVETHNEMSVPPVDVSGDLDCPTPTIRSIPLGELGHRRHLAVPPQRRPSQDPVLVPIWQGSPMAWERRPSSCVLPATRSSFSPSHCSTALITSNKLQTALETFSIPTLGLGLTVAPQAPVVRLSDLSRCSTTTSPSSETGLASGASTRTGSDYFSSVTSSTPPSPRTPSFLTPTEEHGHVSRSRLPHASYKPEPMDLAQYDWLPATGSVGKHWPLSYSVIGDADRNHHKVSNLPEAYTSSKTVKKTFPHPLRQFRDWDPPSPCEPGLSAKASSGVSYSTSRVDRSPFSPQGDSTLAQVPSVSIPTVDSHSLLEPFETDTKLDEISRLDPSAAAQSRQALYDLKVKQGGLRRPAMPPRAWTTSATAHFRTATVEVEMPDARLASPFVPKPSSARTPFCAASSTSGIGSMPPRKQSVDFFHLTTTASARAPSGPARRRRRVVTTNGAFLPLSANDPFRSTTPIESVQIIHKDAMLLLPPRSRSRSRSPLRNQPLHHQHHQQQQQLQLQLQPSHPSSFPILKSFFDDDDDDSDSDSDLNSEEKAKKKKEEVIKDADAQYVERSYADAESRRLLSLSLSLSLSLTRGSSNHPTVPIEMDADETFGPSPSSSSRRRIAT